jgi:hypothetical protein
MHELHYADGCVAGSIPGKQTFENERTVFKMVRN